jgi:hypothetical protein
MLNRCGVVAPLDLSEEWYRREIGSTLQRQLLVVSRNHLKSRAKQGGTGIGTGTDDAAPTKDLAPTKTSWTTAGCLGSQSTASQYA